eukprot:m.30232 g.30232  ORF g.30232 m.30232 type:complete len:105 (-) comp6773_c0_seq1:616-930(-)
MRLSEKCDCTTFSLSDPTVDSSKKKVTPSGIGRTAHSGSFDLVFNLRFSSPDEEIRGLETDLCVVIGHVRARNVSSSAWSEISHSVSGYYASSHANQDDQPVCW